MKKYLPRLFFFVVLILIAVFFYFRIPDKAVTTTTVFNTIPTPTPIPRPTGQIDPVAAFTKPDVRLIALKSYLEGKGCLDSSLAALYIEDADLYKLDWRLMPAISVKESSCGHHFPKATNNLWGFGCLKGERCYISENGSNLIYLDSISAGIDFLGLRLGEMPPYAGKNTLQILKIYNHNPEYAPSVENIMKQIAP